MKSQLEAIIIGPGRMGSNYGRVLKQDPRIKIVAVCGRSLEKTQRLSKELNCKGFAGEKHDEALKLFSAKAQKLVVIATSEWQHLKPLQLSLKAQAAIILEKPLLGNYEEFLQVKNELLSHQHPILPCFTSRFDPKYSKAHEIVTQNNMKAVTIHSRRNTDFETASRVFGKINWPYWIAGHDIDLVRWFTLSEVSSVRAASRYNDNFNHKKDYLQIELCMKNGTRAFIESSWFLPPLAGPIDQSEFRFQSETSIISISNSPSTVWNTPSKISESLFDDFHYQNGRYVGNTSNMIHHFVDVIFGQALPIIGLKDGINSLLASEAILRSLRFEKVISMDEFI